MGSADESDAHRPHGFPPTEGAPLRPDWACQAEGTVAQEVSVRPLEACSGYAKSYASSVGPGCRSGRLDGHRSTETRSVRPSSGLNALVSNSDYEAGR